MGFRGRVPRVWFLSFSLTIIMFGLLLLRLGGFSTVWFAAILVGFGYGGLWGVQPPMIGDLFGSTDYSFKYSCGMLSAALGSVLFNEVLAGPIFQRNSEERLEFPKCYSSVCFNSTFDIAAAACVPAIIVAVLLALRLATLRRTWLRGPRGL